MTTRRTFLQAGALGIGGLALPELFARRAAAANPRPDTSVILLYLHGGPSHLETYDLKPSAPTPYRSIYKPIATTVPGIDICEHFPRQAKLADKFALVRSLNHDVNIHSDGGIVVLTGKRPAVLDPTSNSKSEHPDFGSVACHLRGLSPDAMPPYVAIPRQTYMTRPAYLGEQNASVVVNDPSAGNPLPPQLSLAGRDPALLQNRKKLLGEIDRLRRTLDASADGTPTDRFRNLAIEMLTSPKVAEAFDLTRESDRLRDRYGRHLWGQACLLARRLAVAGTSVVSLYIDTPRTGPDWTNWDDHIQNAGRPGHFGDYMTRRLPYLDEALSALIEDVYARGLDQKILIVVMGEFGRTPRLSTNANGTGRDHWAQAYSALLSGGGLRMGQAIGATNARGEHPIARPYSPQDLLATVYRHLGIETSHELKDAAGRPLPVLADGRPIPELM